MDPGSHVGFQISTKNTNLVEDHSVNISGKFGWFLFSGFREEDLNVNGRTTTHDKSSHGLWPGELKMKRKSLGVVLQTILDVYIYITIYSCDCCP